MSRTRPGLRKRRKSPDEARPRAAAPARESANSAAQARQLPAYMRGEGVSPRVPLLEVDGPTDGQMKGGGHADDETAAARPAEIAAAIKEERAEEERAKQEGAASRDAEEEALRAKGAPPMTPVPDVSGVGETTETVAFASVTLQGKTKAKFRHTFRTANVKEAPGEGCAGCAGKQCVRFTGDIVSTYTVTTTVSLPKVSDFPGLTPCQKERVKDGIDNVLAPHEQQHVAAYNTYAGTATTPFDITVCRADFNPAVAALHDAEAASRESAAQALSDALDPFEFEVDLDCEEPRAEHIEMPEGIEEGAQEAIA